MPVKSLLKPIICLIILLFCPINTRSNQPSISESKKIIFANDLIRLEFNQYNGELTSIINKKTGDNYLKGLHGGNVFRLIINPQKEPVLTAGPYDDALGGEIIDPNQCKLISYKINEGLKSKSLLLKYEFQKRNLEIQLNIDLPNESDRFNAKLSLINNDSKDIHIYTAFPYLTGVQLGATPDNNKTINMWDRGYPGTKAWDEPIGGIYGKEVSMQWQTVYDQDLKQGLAFICMDSEFSNKLLSTFPKGGIASFYFDKRILIPNQKESWPTAKILVYNGNWRTAARAYNQWFSSQMTPRIAPNWYKEKVSTRYSTWFPTKEVVEENKSKNNESLFTSYEQIHDLFNQPKFGNNINDCMEIAMWNEGVNLWPNTYGPWMSSGFIDFRSDLGGVEAFKRGVEISHKFGRKVAMYVAAYGIRKESPILEGKWQQYAIMNKRGKPVMDYRKGKEVYGAFNCPGYGPWQDQLIRICKMLTDAGVDEIRLDEFGFPFRPCYNEAHHHKSPYNANKWMRECLKRIREETDKINPNLFISTEFFTDYFHEFTNGALVMDCPENEVDAMKVALPSYIPLSYHASSSEAAITGAIMGKTSSKRDNWAWGNVGANKPDDYDEDFEIHLRWHELLPTFADAVLYGDVTEWDPIAENDSKWTGHLWKSSNYWVLTGGHIDASPLKTDSVLVKLPELPENIKTAFEFNIETLEMREVKIERTDDGIYLSLKSAVSAVLLPLPNCPPLPIIKQDVDNLKRNSNIEVAVSLFSPWKEIDENKSLDKVHLEAPGFQTSNKKSNENKVFTIVTNDSTPINNFHYTITGNCLKVKRWFEIKR